VRPKIQARAPERGAKLGKANGRGAWGRTQWSKGVGGANDVEWRRQRCGHERGGRVVRQLGGVDHVHLSTGRNVGSVFGEGDQVEGAGVAHISRREGGGVRCMRVA